MEQEEKKIKESCSCQPIVNGYACNNVTNIDLQKIKSINNLQYQVDKSDSMNKLHFLENGINTATAMRIKNAGIQMYATKDYCDTIKK